MTTDHKRGIVFFSLITLMLLYFINAHIWLAVIVFGFCGFMGVMVIVFPNAKVEDGEEYDTDDEQPVQGTIAKTNCLTYYGDELNFDDADIISALTKHSPFYVSLNDSDKKKFLNRLNKFINSKTFKIHDCSGFREMPMLISAAAIQISFGLDKYLLPNFTVINIYPEEFIAVTPTIRFLEGNVSGHSINISWKYFMQGFNLPNDGENVGLHEMAHAYYYQSFGPCDEKDNYFITMFDKFNTCGNDVFQKLSTVTGGIYSDYAKRNFQEFWAESIEIFFEKSFEMKNTYPALYQCVSNILKQDPATEIIRYQ